MNGNERGAVYLQFGNLQIVSECGNSGRKQGGYCCGAQLNDWISIKKEGFRVEINGFECMYEDTNIEAVSLVLEVPSIIMHAPI